MRFQRFTERGRRVLSSAQEEAQRLNQSYIGTEHLLLGLLPETDSVADRVMRTLGVDPSSIRAAVEHQVEHGDIPSPGDIGLTQGAKKVIEMAVAEATTQRHRYLGTGHLLAGLLLEREGIAARVLQGSGLAVQEVRAAVQLVVEQDSSGGQEGLGHDAHAPGRPSARRSDGGASRFEKFSERARRVLSFAQEEAQGFNHNYIAPEHILLGLVRETDGIAARVLVGLGVDLATVRSELVRVIDQAGRPPHGEIGLTPAANKAIELTVGEARQMGHTYIGTEHLLIGIMRENESVAAMVLGDLGLSLDQVRTETLRILRRSDEPSGA